MKKIQILFFLIPLLSVSLVIFTSDKIPMFDRYISEHYCSTLIGQYETVKFLGRNYTSTADVEDVEKACRNILDREMEQSHEEIHRKIEMSEKLAPFIALLRDVFPDDLVEYTSLSPEGLFDNPATIFADTKYVRGSKEFRDTFELRARSFWASKRYSDGTLSTESHLVHPFGTLCVKFKLWNCGSINYNCHSQMQYTRSCDGENDGAEEDYRLRSFLHNVKHARDARKSFLKVALCDDDIDEK